MIERGLLGGRARPLRPAGRVPRRRRAGRRRAAGLADPRRRSPSGTEALVDGRPRRRRPGRRRRRRHRLAAPRDRGRVPAHLRAAGGVAPPDLRFVGVALRVAHELERSADLMVNVAKTTWRLYPRRLDTHRDPPRRPPRPPGRRAAPGGGQRLRRPRPVVGGRARRHGRHHRRAREAAVPPRARGRRRRRAATTAR